MSHVTDELFSFAFIKLMKLLGTSPQAIIRPRLSSPSCWPGERRNDGGPYHAGEQGISGQPPDLRGSQATHLHHTVDAGGLAKVRCTQSAFLLSATEPHFTMPDTLLRRRSAFDMHMGHPSNEARQHLANQLHMSPKSVQVWFQNRRQKLRGQQQANVTRWTDTTANNKPAVVTHPATSSAEVDWILPTQIGDADRRETLHPYALQATPRVVPSPQSAAAYDVGAAAAPVMHPAQGYALPRPCDFQTTMLPAHILSELASVSAAEQDLALFARQLMQRKVELLDTIRRLEQQTTASRHGGHAGGVSPVFPATQAATPLADLSTYKKYDEYQEEVNETFQPIEPFQAPSTPPHPTLVCRLPTPAPQPRLHPRGVPTADGLSCCAGARGRAIPAPVRGLRRPGVLLALPAV